MDPFIGEIILFAGNFAPRGWALCDGQLLSISQNQALFSILGTTYGGDGRTTFALPDLRGRVPVHPGTGPGLSTINQGQKGGTETNTLTEAQIAQHHHLVGCTSSLGNQDSPIGAIPAAEQVPTDSLWSDGNPDGTLQADVITSTGSNQPINNRQPFLGLNYIIALTGSFPSRN